MLTTVQLRERGWTPALVKRFLVQPDKIKPNPYYRSAAPMRFYDLARVEACEREEEWKQAAIKAAARAEIGKAVAVRKASELVTLAERMPISVKRLSLDKLINHAIASYNSFHEEVLWERGHDYERANKQSDPAFLERITVNYIRHELTAYHRHLEELVGQVGVREAEAVIRRRVYDAIAMRYPEYAEECKRQMLVHQGDGDA